MSVDKVLLSSRNTCKLIKKKLDLPLMKIQHRYAVELGFKSWADFRQSLELDDVNIDALSDFIWNKNLLFRSLSIDVLRTYFD